MRREKESAKSAEGLFHRRKNRSRYTKANVVRDAEIPLVSLSPLVPRGM
jgi:hypothetical protein